MTAQELMEKLAKDPQYQEAHAIREREWAERAETLRKDAEPLIADLTTAGWPPLVAQQGKYRSVWDLVNTAEPYPHLFPVLVNHLQRPYLKPTKEGIVRALAVIELRGTDIQHVLVQELKQENDPSEGINSYRWAIVNTLATIGDSSIQAEIDALLADPLYASVQLELQRLAKKLTRRPARKP